MQIVRSSEELAAARVASDGSIALVPTMGALHAGHMALIAEARRRADKVAATIFVNPMQFAEGEDFGRYPRAEAEDIARLEAAGCDLLWIPVTKDIYPDGYATTVRVSRLSERWEGEARPGHFNGVATIVAKILIAVRPNVAVFGEKDFQQLAVVRRMVEDLGIPAEVAAVPTVREEDGLALSSRNAYLTKDERGRAVALYRALRNARSSVLAGQPVEAALAEARTAMLLAGFTRVDYFALVDAATLNPIEAATPEARLLAAAVLGKTRLIDNLAL